MTKALLIRLRGVWWHWRDYMADVLVILSQIWHMLVVKRHVYAAVQMLKNLPKLVVLRRAEMAPEYISPFIYVMQ